jgi:uncharacterized protein
MLKLYAIILFFLISTEVASQSAEQPVDSAMLYLTGTFRKYDPQKAFSIFMQRAQNGDAKAMNAIGMQYAKGLGVDSSFSSASLWFLNAANNGYSKAWVNLGMLYKRLGCDSINYSIACSYFDSALLKNEPSAFFAKGYMHYKGLGCQQSYTEALRLFRQGVEYQRSECMYFVGLSFKHGYGVTPNSDSATFYIDKAARLGYNQANRELANNIADSNAMARGTSTRSKVQISEPKLAKEQYTKPNNSNQYLHLNGSYEGYLTQYDYSGKFIIGRTSVKLQLHGIGNRVCGNFKVGNNESIEILATQIGNQLNFSPVSYIHALEKARRKKIKLLLKSSNLEYVVKEGTLYLKGNLQLYNSYTRELEKPISIELTQSNKVDFSSSKFPGGIAIQPNPVKNAFSATFNLTNESTVSLRIYDPSGKLVFKTNTGTLPAGKQKIDIDAFLKATGVYILSIAARNQRETIVFVKE